MNEKKDKIRPPTLKKQIGKTTYIAKAYFSEKTDETFSDKIRRLVRNDVKKS